MATVRIAARLHAFTVPGSLGQVRDVRFINCYWPHLAQPVDLFANGSNQIQVEGVPTPRNVVFPGGTQFLDYSPDAHHLAREAYHAAFPGRPFIDLTDDQAAVYMTALAAAETALPSHATRIATRGDCFFLRHEHQTGTLPNGKPLRDSYVGELTAQDTGDLVSGVKTRNALREEKQFRKLDGPDDQLYDVRNGDNPSVTPVSGVTRRPR